MKKIYSLLSALVLLLSFDASAQYSTPGTGVVWNLDSLTANAGNAVTKANGEYTITQNITVLAGDSLYIIDNATVKFSSGVLVTFQGGFHVSPPDSVLFTTSVAGQFYKSFRFEQGSAGYFKNAIVEYGGGIRILETDLVFDSCTVRYNGTSNSTSGAFALFKTNTIVMNSDIHDNVGPAFGGGANIANAPRILSNQIINNNTANANKPQINMGGTGADTIKIIGNHIKGGPYDRAGAISFLTFGGAAKILIKDNIIEDNRYGIALYGAIDAQIINNDIINNDIENLPLLGGSGITLQGGNTISAVLTKNRIKGNLWGITRVASGGNPGPILNLGDTLPGGNPGLNEFEGNVNYQYHVSGSNVNDTTFAIYNNASDDVTAFSNYWGATTVAGAEENIFHSMDDITLGTVHFQPMLTSPVAAIAKVELRKPSSFLLWPNPASDRVSVRLAQVSNGLSTLQLYDCQGRLVTTEEIPSGRREATFTMNGLAPGLYLVHITNAQGRSAQRLILK